MLVATDQLPVVLVNAKQVTSRLPLDAFWYPERHVSVTTVPIVVPNEVTVWVFGVFVLGFVLQ